MPHDVHELLERAAHVPSVLVNRFVVQVNPITTKIVLGEALEDIDAYPRCAVVMTTSNAEELAHLILRSIERNRRQKQDT